MWKWIWGAILSAAFAIALTFTPLPEGWRIPVVIAAWSICGIAAFGWIFSHWREKHAPRRKQPQPVIVAIDELKSFLYEGEILVGRFQDDSTKPTFQEVEDWRTRMLECAQQNVLATDGLVTAKDYIRLKKKWDEGEVLTTTANFVDHGCFANGSTHMAVFQHLWGQVERLKEVIAKIEDEELPDNELSFRPPSDIEQKVSQWIDAFGLSRKILVNEKAYFGFQVSLPPRIIISILRPKKRPSYLTLNSRIRMNDKQRAFFDKKNKAEQMSLHRKLRLECSRSKIVSHWDPKLEVVCVHKELQITSDLTEARFRDTIREVIFSDNIVMDTMDTLMPPS